MVGVGRGKFGKGNCVILGVKIEDEGEGKRGRGLVDVNLKLALGGGELDICVLLSIPR